MAYRVMDLDALYHMGRSAGTNYGERLETALNMTEHDGWVMLHVLPQRQLWDDEGQPNGKAEMAFVFHKPDEAF